MWKVLGGLVVVVAAAWFGIDLTNNSGDSSTQHASQMPTRVSTPHSSTVSSKTPAPKASASTTSVSSNLPACPINSLPAQADEVVEEILSGGPFKYPTDDGSHFGNYQRVLPRKNNDFYREYTVETPGLGHRGSKRIVVGGGTDTDPEVWYYTDDHYESFCEIPDAEN